MCSPKSVNENTVLPNGPEVRRSRQRCGLTQEGLAEECKLRGRSVSKRTIERIEQGRPTTLSTLANLADSLGEDDVATLILFEKTDSGEQDTGGRPLTAHDASPSLRLGRLFGIPFSRRYRRRLCARHGFMDLGGLKTLNVCPVPINSVAVDMHVAPQNPQAIETRLLHTGTTSSSTTIWPYLIDQRDVYRSLAVLGPPGSGKTTLLKTLCLAFAQGWQWRRSTRCRRLVPIFVQLRHHIDTFTAATNPSLADLVTAVEAAYGLAPPPGWFERMLTKGKCLVLLDGLDEIPDLAARREAVGWIDEQIERYHSCRFLLTSRLHGYISNPSSRVTVLEVQPLDLSQAARFVNAWHAVLPPLQSPTDTTTTSPQAKADALMVSIRSSPALSELASHPLLLTMITMIQQFCGVLPQSRHALYAEICDVLLGGWREARGLKSDLSRHQQLDILKRIAFHMMREHTSELPQESILALLCGDSPDSSGLSSSQAARDLDEITQQSGLIGGRTPGAYEFAHPTFQEYLAALHIYDIDAGEIISDAILDPWWHDCIRFYASIRGASGVIDACLNSAQDLAHERSSGRVSALRLAWECSVDARSTSPHLASQVTADLLKDLEADDADRRRVAAEVLLSLRLKNLVRLSEHVAIDMRYMCCAEYQLFLDVSARAGEYRHPDHWTDARFARGSASRPIAGIRRSDAIAFCNWLTRRERESGNGHAAFRLPDAMELEAVLPVDDPEWAYLQSNHDDAVGAWCLGDPPRVAGLPKVQRARVVQAVRECGHRYWTEALTEVDQHKALRKLHSHRPFGDGDSTYARAALDLACESMLDYDVDLDTMLDILRTSGFEKEVTYAMRRDDDPMHDYTEAQMRRTYEELLAALGCARNSDNRRSVLANARAFCAVVASALAQNANELAASHPAVEFGSHWTDVLSAMNTSRRLWSRSSRVHMHTFLVLACIEHRSRGQLWAWEGIRIVQDRASDGGCSPPPRKR